MIWYIKSHKAYWDILVEIHALIVVSGVRAPCAKLLMQRYARNTNVYRQNYVIPTHSPSNHFTIVLTALSDLM